MPIPTVCPHCQANYALADHFAGKKVRCKYCDGIIAVRNASEGPGRPERIQKEPRSAKAGALREEEPERPRRRESGARPRSGGNRGLLIGLIAAAVVLLFLVAAGGI